MKKTRGILIFTFLSMLQSIHAQDIHWSQFVDNPIFQSPGQAGNFEGDNRFIANYRDQWRSVTIPYQTTSISVDRQLLVNRKWLIGAGLLVFHDVVGDGKLKTLELQANFNLPISLNTDSTLILRPGINLGMNQRSFNSTAFFYDSQFNGVVYDPSLSTNETFLSDAKTNFSTGAGAVLDWKINAQNKWNAGIGFYNLNRPNQGFFDQKITRDIRTNVFVKYDKSLQSNLSLLPAANLSFQGKYRELVFGTSIKYFLNKQKIAYRTIQAGVWYRMKDAGYFTAGTEYQNWFFGVSYDLNFSKLTQASGARGGIEFAVRYTTHSVKPKKITHRICPDYI